MFGFYGRVLTVNLRDKTFEIEAVKEEVCGKVLGGKGLATHLLLTKNPPAVDPLSPDNHLIFATGPVCQSSLWGGSRYGVFTKSPQTGFYSESYSGGKVPEAMDASGFDAVVIRGKAGEPTALSVYPEGCEFFDAGDLWGMETYRAEDEARKRFSITKPGFRKLGAVVIGSAGEKQQAELA
jgi:aldehyde:ferredoxin oxidoreductase